LKALSRDNELNEFGLLFIPLYANSSILAWSLLFIKVPIEIRYPSMIIRQELPITHLHMQATRQQWSPYGLTLTVGKRGDSFSGPSHLDRNFGRVWPLRGRLCSNTKSVRYHMRRSEFDQAQPQRHLDCPDGGLVQ
jgi:hypothetical protein